MHVHKCLSVQGTRSEQFVLSGQMATAPTETGLSASHCTGLRCSHLERFSKSILGRSRQVAASGHLAVLPPSVAPRNQFQKLGRSEYSIRCIKINTDRRNMKETSKYCSSTNLNNASTTMDKTQKSQKCQRRCSEYSLYQNSVRYKREQQTGQKMRESLHNMKKELCKEMVIKKKNQIELL